MALTLASIIDTSAQNKNPEWLSNTVFYDIYPSSFMDTDGNGIGDLNGIISKLDYVKSLGCNAIWMNPIYLSGWMDGGYDIIDFYKVDPRFGRNADVVRLVNEAHKRGIKVCLDLVAGHTSNKSKWFLESSKGDRYDRYGDYFIWTDSISHKDSVDIAERNKEGNPNISLRGRFVKADAPRGCFYMKNYYPSQPALNYGFAHPDSSHPWEQSVNAPGPRAVRQELKNIMAFWYGLGVDGFRVDMASSLVKEDEGHKETMKIWQDIRRWMDSEYPGHILISEWGDAKEAIIGGFNVDFYLPWGNNAYGDLINGKTWNSNNGSYFDKNGNGHIANFVNRLQSDLSVINGKGFIAIPSSNHDFKRPNNYDRNNPKELKVFMTFLLTMPGVPFIHYGDEIGMRFQTNLPNKEGSSFRGGSRTPMQWDGTSTAGFSKCTPDKLYFPVFTDNGKITVEAEQKDKNSLLNHVKKLIYLRHNYTQLGNDGDLQFVSDINKPYPMVYVRTNGKSHYLIAVNPSNQKVSSHISICCGKTKVLDMVGTVKIKKDNVEMGAMSSAIIAY